MLVSAVMSIMSIYRLPHGQYGYSGHVINLPQDVASFATRLPCLPSELDVIVVRKEGAGQSHRDFHVRRSVVLRALQWLVVHNKYYCANRVHIDATALDQLPKDGHLTQLTAISVESPISDNTMSATDTLAFNSPDDDPYNAHLPQSFVPIATQVYDRARGSAAVSGTKAVQLVQLIHLIFIFYHYVAFHRRNTNQ